MRSEREKKKRWGLGREDGGVGGGRREILRNGMLRKGINDRVSDASAKVRDRHLVRKSLERECQRVA